MTRDPLALDPLDPPLITPIQHTSSTMDPLALDPLSPISFGARPIDASREQLEIHTRKALT